MSVKGIPAPTLTRWVPLVCGHVILFAPPYPAPYDEVTCGVCWKSTEVAA